MKTEMISEQVNKTLETTPEFNPTVRDLFQTRAAGHTIGMLIAERKYNRSGNEHQSKIDKLAKQLSIYEGILPDPFNPNRRLNIRRLIACVDGKK